MWLGPWFGIFIVDYLLRRGRYDTTSLAVKRGGIYWRNGGFNWKALVALGLAMFAAMTWIDAAFYFPAYSSFFSNRTHGADFSWLFGLVVGGLVYDVLSASTVRKEAQVQPGTVTERALKRLTRGLVPGLTRTHSDEVERAF